MIVWVPGLKEGYAGVGVMTKQKPLKKSFGIGVPKFDADGRVITLEYESFYLVNVYVPNSGRGLVNLEARQEWDVKFREYLQDLDSKKPVIIAGDMNVSHLEIDLANPKSNKKNAGFTQEERDGFSTLLETGFLDTFRQFYPGKTGAYTFWTYMGNARGKNVGWRLDYFIVSKRFMDQVCDNRILADVLGSDHCPIALDIKL
ncbi:unnamed protein product [Notodromas monacha]|uniref:DNA repair nuclease/redox regulator APEX1 n=1 Tax=Notodromas monacha TaxID=399045 RepID=A0A7R9BD63_9CRUS|nr:unnamed protein product [Notodromas monacha]CAG0913185.1 unnamed protein product [Notodromas monacha]